MVIMIILKNLQTTCEGGRFFPAWTIVFDERSVDNDDDNENFIFENIYAEKHFKHDDHHFWEHVCQPKI